MSKVIKFFVLICEWMSTHASKSYFMWSALQRQMHLIDRSCHRLAFILLAGLVNMSSSIRNLGAYFDESMSISCRVLCNAKCALFIDMSQIGFHSPRWFNERVIITLKPRCILWWKHVHDRTCESSRMFVLFPNFIEFISSNQTYSIFSDDYGNNSPYELIHYRQLLTVIVPLVNYQRTKSAESSQSSTSQHE